MPHTRAHGLDSLPHSSAAASLCGCGNASGEAASAGSQCGLRPLARQVARLHLQAQQYGLSPPSLAVAEAAPATTVDSGKQLLGGSCSTAWWQLHHLLGAVAPPAEWQLRRQLRWTVASQCHCSTAWWQLQHLLRWQLRGGTATSTCGLAVLLEAILGGGKAEVFNVERLATACARRALPPHSP